MSFDTQSDSDRTTCAPTCCNEPDRAGSSRMRADACRAAPRTTGAAPSRRTREGGSGLMLISCYGGVGAGFDVQCGCTAGRAGVVVDAPTTEQTARRSAAARPRTGAPHEQEVADLRRDHRRRPRDGAACKCRPREAANECATLLRAVRPSAVSSAASCCSSRPARSAFAWLRSRATLGLVSSQLSACNEPGASRTSRMRAVDATDTQHCRSKCICHHVDHARTRSIYAASKRAQGIEYWRACHGV